MLVIFVNGLFIKKAWSHVNKLSKQLYTGKILQLVDLSNLDRSFTLKQKS